MKKALDFKSLLALLMVTALIFGLFLNKITSQDFIPLVSIVISFYFATKKKDEDN